MIIDVFRIYKSINNLDIYLILVPLILLLLCSYIEKSKITEKFYDKNSFIFRNIKVALKMSIFLYLVMRLFYFSVYSHKEQIIVLLVCLFGILISTKIRTEKIDLIDIEETNPRTSIKNNLFNTYYINVSKVFEIAMLINNKIMTVVQNESTLENSKTKEERINTNINLEYLNSIKNGLEYSNNYKEANSEKNRVLENFDVKTTKSNLLDILINKCKKYEKSIELKPGDLLIFKDVKFDLINQEETMQIMKLLLNGAFNGTVISGQADEMHMELNMASLINSFLKDYSYELKCQVTGIDFFIKIPMSFDNDFENSYNIYDLLIGKMTLIGIYKGKDNEKKYKSFSEILSNSSIVPQTPKENEKASDNILPSQLKQSSKIHEDTSERSIVENSTVIDDVNKNTRNFIDVIAIIQEINFDEAIKNAKS